MDMITLAEGIPSNVRWFEPYAHKARSVRVGILVGSIMLFVALILAFGALFNEKLTHETSFFIGIFSPVGILSATQRINTHKIMANRLGFDRAMGYLRNYDLKIVICRPS